MSGGSSKCRRARGFTLLEVMIAMSILVVALAALLGHEGVAIQMSDFSNRLSQASLLAQGKMLDLQYMLLKDGMDSLDSCEDGDFRDDGDRKFHWKACAYKLEMDDGAVEQLTEQVMSMMGGMGLEGVTPEALDAFSQGGAAADALDPATKNALRVLSQTQMAAGAIPMFLQQLEDRVRKVRLEVTWKDAVDERVLIVERFVTTLGADAVGEPPPTDGDAEQAPDTDLIAPGTEMKAQGEKK